MPMLTMNEWSPGRRPPFNLQANREANPEILDEEFW
jgi:hypothetical protein